ncbi:MAG: bifunctional UDP-N-acetylglucosamine diphosphorylase/glucosamine-1-phosphate N-acetyltransferase GlmU [Nisaea sp.]|uniref:bifunctional UDP-N-acetylglucosamine diphosphorylase/glucosamine-1-phosphate N-acetyltransferase GlmU n=1 Tax=Nisaea sp. TaxID=2024842 RepID=UPI001B05DC40|nr:bifunctional UDP-N-acetylglucosamine diphosphorylase/glucosamine-1-phosphate N-acetyltransferase GlmU [Nisaea sp.]MBO6560629.1 bifunctional UDP-N-acetylglucosamine diphosphorylase/glucosamine-1-phosphate N-acetyltransferase GlmU [Nisaea sp.]
MNDPVAVVVLAAGKGTRMKSDLPKVLHTVAGRPMLHHVLAATEPLQPARRVVVLSPGQEAVAASIAPIPTAIQHPPRGTGDAVRAAKAELEGFTGTVLVLFGDTPLLTPETLSQMVAMTEGPDGAAFVILGFELDSPGRYARLVLDEAGGLRKIIEAPDLKGDEVDIKLCNGGALAVDGSRLFDWLERLEPHNAQGEFYLFDLLDFVHEEGRKAGVVWIDPVETMGVDSRAGLAAAEAKMQERLRRRVMDEGVTLVAPETVFLSFDTVIGQDSVVQPHCVFGPGVKIGPKVEIKSFSHLEGATVGLGARVGPYARLRPGAELGERVHVGNFVEVKNARFGDGAKANHLSYVGDAEVGAGANIGAGTITCNYDGFEKHLTEIGAGAFIGSNTALVAPVRIGEGALVGAGSTVTEDVGANDIVAVRGARKVVPGAAVRYRETRAARKAAKKKDS